MDKNTITEGENLKECFENFVVSARKLTEAWEKAEEANDASFNALCQGYPFNECFQDIVVDIDFWHAYAMAHFKRLEDKSNS